MPSGLRRASIVAAALPLLRRHGVAVTTAQIATAAGVAEGTLFRIFPDKEALIAATVQAAFDPSPAETQLRAIDRRRSLREQMVAAVEVLQRHVEQVWQLISILGMSGPPKRSGPAAARGRGPAGAADAAMRAQLVAILEPHRDQLRCKPAHAARLLRLMTFACTHPRITENQPLAAAEVVDILLDGIRARKEEEST
jgi:AcrR family transcriptional regulator